MISKINNLLVVAAVLWLPLLSVTQIKISAPLSINVTNRDKVLFNLEYDLKNLQTRNESSAGFKSSFEVVSTYAVHKLKLKSTD